MTQKVAREVALQDFERFCHMMAAYSDAESLKAEEDIKSFEENRDRFVGAIQAGSLVVESDGTVTYTPSNGGSDLKFSEPLAYHLLAVDRYKKDQNMHKSIALIAALTGKTESEIGKLPQRDMRVLNAIVAGFF